MSQFTAHVLLFEARVERPIHLGEHPGAAIRGALFHALRGRPERPGFCIEPPRPHCRGCAALAGCPVSFLLATVDVDGRRGSDVPRPYTMEPPLDTRGYYTPGERFTFGLTVFARALSLFPYVIVAARRLEEEGIGRAVPDGRGQWQRGRFTIERVVARNPLTGEEQVVHQRGDELVAVPNIPVTHAQVLALAEALADRGRLSLEFLTTTRLIEGGRQLRAPAPRPLCQRLIERLSSLWEEYCDEELPVDYADLMARAGAARLLADETAWREVRGYSTRQEAPKSLAGFVGRATYEGDLDPLLPWLVWGELAHVGKDAVKGCGLYRILGDESTDGRVAGAR
ncbi:MAG: CRISPR system precrRNA processing endoribonuclease RAMP protein Cas6 [Chloroflexota bacterium]